MKTNETVKLFLNLAKVQNTLTRRFDSSLNGISLSEFLILFNLSQAENGKMRRVDLAEKVGLTASGVTRLLLPMQKIGLVKTEADENDARTSLVSLASGGKTKLSEGIERAEIVGQDLLPNVKNFKAINEVLFALGANIK